jgi:hypothetical protein
VWAGAGQPKQWTIQQGGNDHWYQAVGVCPGNVGVTWPEASAYATSRGAYLATITSASENQFVFDLSSDSKYWFWPEPTSNASIGPWLGGHQDPGAIEAGGSWQWVNGEGYFMDSNGAPVGYTNWRSSEPNNAIDQENALHFFGNGGSFKPEPTWNDFPEAGRILAEQYYVARGFVVESDSPIAPVRDWCQHFLFMPLAASD